MSNASDAVIEIPPMPQKLRSVAVCNADQMQVLFRSRGDAGGVFLVLWLIGWTAGCVMLAIQAALNPAWGTILFGVPFWASWLLVFALVMQKFFQREFLSLDGTGVSYTRRIFKTFKTRIIPLGELKTIHVYSTLVDAESKQMETGIEVLSLGRPLLCLKGVPEAELAWLEYQFGQRLEALRAGVGVAAKEGGSLVHSPVPAGSQGTLAVVSTMNSLAAIPEDAPVPMDSDWRRVDGFGDIAFERRGRWMIGSVLATAFLNAFWNGIVLVFVLTWLGVGPVKNPPNGGERWFLGVFLIPFEVIGLIMFAAFVMALFEPAHRTVVRCGSEAIDISNRWFGFGWQKRFAVAGLGRLQLRAETTGETNRRIYQWRVQTAQMSSGLCVLKFIDRENREVCTLGGLTEGEGRWIGGTILRERAAWFR